MLFENIGGTLNTCLTVGEYVFDQEFLWCDFYPLRILWMRNLLNSAIILWFHTIILWSHYRIHIRGKTQEWWVWKCGIKLGFVSIISLETSFVWEAISNILQAFETMVTPRISNRFFRSLAQIFVTNILLSFFVITWNCHHPKPTWAILPSLFKALDSQIQSDRSVSSTSGIWPSVYKFSRSVG